MHSITSMTETIMIYTSFNNSLCEIHCAYLLKSQLCDHSEYKSDTRDNDSNVCYNGEYFLGSQVCLAILSSWTYVLYKYITIKGRHMLQHVLKTELRRTSHSNCKYPRLLTWLAPMMEINFVQYSNTMEYLSSVHWTWPSVQIIRVSSFQRWI